MAELPFVPISRGPLVSELSVLPKLPPGTVSSYSHYDGPSIAMFILSSFALVLFIIFMIIWIVSWARSSSAKKKLQQTEQSKS